MNSANESNVDEIQDVNVHEIKLLLIMQAHLLSFLIMFSICKNNDVDRMITLQFSLSVGVWCSCLERSGKVVTEMNQQLCYLNGSNERHAQKQAESMMT